MVLFIGVIYDHFPLDLRSRYALAAIINIKQTGIKAAGRKDLRLRSIFHLGCSSLSLQEFYISATNFTLGM